MEDFLATTQHAQEAHDRFVRIETEPSKDPDRIAGEYFALAVQLIAMIASVETDEDFCKAYHLTLEAKRYEPSLVDTWETVIGLLAVLATRKSADLKLMRTIAEAFPTENHMLKIILEERIEKIGQRPIV